jgi:hypothetical protein
MKNDASQINCSNELEKDRSKGIKLKTGFNIFLMFPIPYLSIHLVNLLFTLIIIAILMIEMLVPFFVFERIKIEMMPTDENLLESLKSY